MKRHTIGYLVGMMVLCGIVAEVEKLKIAGIEPDAGPLSGGTRVLVRGGPFKGREREFKRPKCKFGSTKRIVNATYVRCKTTPNAPGTKEPEIEAKNDVCLQCDNNPAGEEAEIIPFTISLTGDFTDAANSIHYRYYPDPVVHAIYPRYGRKNGGTFVEIWGDNFLNFDQYLRCSFGTKESPAYFVDEHYIYCYSPSSDVVDAPMPLGITMNDQQFSNMIDYWYYDFPSIYMLDPNRGPDTGGTHVLLKGNNFDPFSDLPIKNYNDTFCRFGPLGTVPVQVINSTKVVCVSPPSYILREVEVEITLNTREWTRDANIFHYYRPPFVYDIEPLMGPVAGGTEVRIHGSNFEDSGKIRCKFGENTVPGQFVNVNEIKCLSPRTDKPGYVPFQLAVYEDDFTSTDLFRFLYYDTPVIKSIEPTCGPERGYTQIIVTGENFIDPGFNMVFCVFNNSILMNATVYEPNRIKCSSPPVLNRQGVNEEKVQFYDVKITLNRKDFSGPAKRFHYYKEASISSVTPSGGPIEGGTLVTLTGKGLKPECACNVTVRFGTFQVRPLTYNDTTVVVKAPNVTLPDDVVVSYGINGQQYNPDIKLNFRDVENTYTYYAHPMITFYHPRRGPSCGGTLIKILGLGLTPFRDNEGTVVKRPIWIRMRQHAGKASTELKLVDFADNENLHWTTPPGEPDSKHVMEVTLNGVDFSPILPINETYSYTYYQAPSVESISPPYGPVDPPSPVVLTVKGKHFNCPDNDCSNLTCRFGKGDDSIFVKGERVSSTEVKCVVPKYNRPDVVPVEVSLDKIYYTNNNKEYGFFDPFVWSVRPKMVSKKGGTTITIHGYGFVNTTGEHLKVRYGYAHKKLTARDRAAVFIDKNTVQAKTYPYNDVLYESSRLQLNKDHFAVEVSVYGDSFTKNNVSIFYFSEPDYGEPSPNQAAANMNESIIIPANFHTNKADPAKGANDEEIFRKYGNATCRFTSKGGKVIVTQGILLHYPPKEADETLNSVSCPSPVFSLPKGTEHETLTLDISVNGEDYSGTKTFKITEDLAVYRIYPTCGPTYGKTKMTLIGTGMKYFERLHVKWGVFSTSIIDRDRIQNLIYSQNKHISENPYENEVLSLNEDVKLYYENMKQYQSTFTYSPKLPNWDKTHGGQMYLELGRTHEIKIEKSKPFLIHNYGPSFIEYYYYKQPILKDIKPRGGPTTGGTLLIVRGAWFKYMPEYGVIPYIKIGEKVSRCVFESTVRIICKTPPNTHTSSTLPLSISLNGVDFGTESVNYHYYHPPLIKDIEPKSGPESGGTRIHLRGEKFTNLSSPSDFKCRFTSVDRQMPPKYIPAIYENSTSIVCPSPGGWSSGSKVSVELTFNGEDYTDSGSLFYFYSILSAYPRSGPSDGSAGPITIHGSGFKKSDLIHCFFDKTKYRPVEVTWSTIKCKIPKSNHGDQFFGNVPLEVTVNGIDNHVFEGGFHYYPQIVVTDFYPKTGPAKGKGSVRFYGKGFRADFALASPGCKFGPYIGKGEVLSESEMVCRLPPIHIINQTYKGEAALNSHSFVTASSGAEFVPYGIYDINPYSGPLGFQTQITVTGEGFSREGKAQCRFGIPGDYAILEGKVLSSQKMLCLSPKKFEYIPKIMEIPFAVPFSLSFFDEKVNPWTKLQSKKTTNATEYKFDPWTETGHVFRFYTNPVIIRLSPKSCKVGEITDVYAYANPKVPFVEPILPIYRRETQSAVKCMFGRFGVTPAVYINATTVRCVSPHIQDDPETIREEYVNVKVAINGQDYTAENENTGFVFIGTATVFIYWPYIIGIVLGLFALIALIICCSAVVAKVGESQPVREEGGRKHERGPGMGSATQGRPHALRDDFGFWRTRGYFQDKSPSPAPGGRGSYYPGQSVKMKSMLSHSPGTYNI